MAKVTFTRADKLTGKERPVPLNSLEGEGDGRNARR